MSVSRSLTEHLRQMIAVLEQERQALAGLDLDALMIAQTDKSSLCDTLESDVAGVDDRQRLGEECRALAQSARHLNEVNRTIRNLMAANVAARLDALTGRPGLYEVSTVRRQQL